jgi:serine/threonine protein phosphatase PrpC
MYKFTMMRGDVLLLTTDGLIDFAGPNQAASETSVFSVLASEPDPALACLELILLANRGGGGDNVGVGIVQLY